MISGVVHLLNQPLVKEGIKYGAGAATFCVGLHEVCCPSKKNYTTTTEKVLAVCSKTSLILSAGVSRPGIYLISTLTGSLFSTAALARVFGPNTIFAVNPWHPRHLASIAAVILALPPLVHAAWHRGKSQEPSAWLLFNTATSRPVLHIGNQLAQSLIKV